MSQRMKIVSIFNNCLTIIYRILDFDSLFGISFVSMAAILELLNSSSLFGISYDNPVQYIYIYIQYIEMCDVVA